ncbi:MAG: hypothetical protein HC908_00525 [Calothrix sp. SM1_7_51]|nr:hypothetical protein [Calothrix sp. SM1_7_51]
MEIGFIDQEQEELCTNHRRLKKKVGGQEAIVKSMAKHMANLIAASVLADMYKQGICTRVR